MKKFYSALVFITTIISVPSLSQTWQWAKQFGGNGNDRAYNISTDAFGNSYVAGEFQDSISFGSQMFYSHGFSDMFFLKLDTSGNVIWALTYGSNDYDYGQEIIADDNGNCYLLGAFHDTLIVGGFTLISAGIMDMFLAKIDANQNIVWAKRGGGTGNDEPFALSLDDSGNIYVVTPFQGTAYFENDSVDSQGGYDNALVKYDNNGNELCGNKCWW